MVFPAASPGLTPADVERMGDEIARLSAHIHAATYELLVRLREFDECGGWGGGFRSCAHWLSWRTGIAPGAAREKVRTARALRELPLISDAMRRGELSFAKVRAITRVASADSEQELLEVARAGTAAHVERIVRAWRRVDRLEEQYRERERHRSRVLTVYPDADGMFIVRGRLDPEAGALLRRALQLAAEELFGRSRVPEQPGGERVTAGQRYADALGRVAERALAADSTARTNAEIVVHVDSATLIDGSSTGESVLEDAGNVSAETSRRLACDARIVRMTQIPDGTTADASRRGRSIPPSTRRALMRRDAGCRFPGCGLKFCDAHHIVHWADGGPTTIDNLVMLCRPHHRAVHEDGFTVHMDANRTVTFYAPNGRLVPAVPPAARLPDDPAASLVAQQDDLDIHPGTPLSGWKGERLDLDLALKMLRPG